MSLRLRLIDLGLRLTAKRLLARLQTPEEMRASMERDARLLQRAPRGTRTEEMAIPAGDGRSIRALRTTVGDVDPGRAILYLHGGAYLAGSPETHRHVGAALSRASGLAAFLPDYRLAPEHPLPAATEDALAAYRFLLEAGLPGSRIALAGDSAGGGLIFLLAQRLAREGLPAPAALVAYSPWTDLAMRGESLRTNARHDAMLPVSRFREVADHCRGALPADDPRVSPVYGALETPPPALIFAGDGEILLDDARRMAERLEAAGGEVRLEIWRGTPHALPIFRGWLPEADRAVRLSGAFIATATVAAS